MKTLILIRHAKSSWKHNLPDHKRPLKSRGKNDAKLLAKHLKSAGFIQPDKIVISDAVRAKQTSEIFIKYLNWESIDTYLNHDLYDFSGEMAFNVIASTPNTIDTLVIFGHNPTFTLLASQMGSKFIDNIPTSGLVQIQFEQDDWSKVKKGLTVKTLYPKSLK
jgi:phosphohistidine phosphatase